MASPSSIYIGIMVARNDYQAVIHALIVSFLTHYDDIQENADSCKEIDLPEYDSYEMLRHNLFTAITQGADHFGFA